MESGGPGLQAVCPQRMEGRAREERKARRVRKQEQASEPASRRGGCRGEGPLVCVPGKLLSLQEDFHLIWFLLK